MIDAPCSGLGVLRRNPDAKWKLKPEFLAEIQKTQADILDRYSKILKPGGKMVYATCSILPSENQKQIAAFLRREAGQEFSLVKEKPYFRPNRVMTGFTWRCWKENNALGIAVEILLCSKRLQRKARPTEASAKVGNAQIKILI